MNHPFIGLPVMSKGLTCFSRSYSCAVPAPARTMRKSFSGVAETDVAVYQVTDAAEHPRLLDIRQETISESMDSSIFLLCAMGFLRSLRPQQTKGGTGRDKGHLTLVGATLILCHRSQRISTVVLCYAHSLYPQTRQTAQPPRARRCRRIRGRRPVPGRVWR